LAMRASRNGAIKKYLSRDIHVFPAMPESEFDKIALQVAADGEVSEALMKRLRAGAPPLPLLEHPDDVTTLNEINDATRSVDLFKRAITLHDRQVNSLRGAQLAEIYESVRGERENISRKIAGAVLNLAAAVSD